MDHELSYGEIFRTLGKSIREYKRDTLITPIFMIGEVAIECVLPFYTSQIIDQINLGAPMEEIFRVGIVLIVWALISLAFGAAGGIYGSRAAAGFAKNLRHDMFASIQGFSFGNIDNFSTSSLVTRLTTDVSNVQMSYLQLIRGAVVILEYALR